VGRVSQFGDLSLVVAKLVLLITGSLPIAHRACLFALNMLSESRRFFV